jgi:hypothetical protein
MSKYRIVDNSYLPPYNQQTMYLVEEAMYYKDELIGFMPKMNVASIDKAEEYIKYYINTKPIIYKEYE